MMTLFWVLFGYCLLERLAELALSRRNRRAMHELGLKERAEGGLLQCMILQHAGWYVSMLFEVVWFPKSLPWNVQLAAGVVFIIAQALRVWTLVTLGRYWNIAVMSPDGTSNHVVHTGPYAWIRHPNYLVVILELVTLPLIGGAVITAVLFSLLNGIVLRRRIATEERYLFANPEYVRVMGGKSRFLPRVL